MALYIDRHDAGKALGRALSAHAGAPDAVVLGLPRGGVVVAYEVADLLQLPLGVFVVRKLGVPGEEELAMGAIASGGVRVLAPDIVSKFAISEETIEQVVERERMELERRERKYRAGRPPLDVAGRTVILVDDGMATGSTMRAALKALRALGPGRLVAAVPVGAEESCAEMWKDADEVVCGRTPRPFYGVGMWYHEFGETSDSEVRALLDLAWRRVAAA